MSRQRKADHIEVTVKIKHLAQVKRVQKVVLRPVCASTAFQWVIDTLEATKIVPEDETRVGQSNDQTPEAVECGE